MLNIDESVIYPTLSRLILSMIFGALAITVYISTPTYLLLFTKYLATFVMLMSTIMNTRLKQFIAAENISQSQFADAIKVVRASVSHVLSGRNKPGYDFITAIMNAYPNLNMEWLMLGKGKMYKSQEQTTHESAAVMTADSAFEDFTEPNVENDLPLLFDYDDEVLPSSVAPATAMPQHSEPPQTAQIRPSAHVSPSAPAMNSMNTLDNVVQSVVKQRNAVKLIIFYDDGTFQEMYTRR